MSKLRKLLLVLGFMASTTASAQYFPMPLMSANPSMQVIPNGPDINLSGDYIGRLVGYQNQSALLNIQVEVSGFEVTATLTSRADKKTYRASGTRSVYPASPVKVNLLGVAGQGSVCEGGAQEQYIVNATFVAASEASGAGGRGQVQHLICDPVVRQFRPDNMNSGQLELMKK